MQKNRLFYRIILFVFLAVMQLCVFPIESGIAKEKKGKTIVPDFFCRQSADSSSAEKYYRDLYPDTWVGSDALGRKMPSFKEVGLVKKDKTRVVSIFYITWHTKDHYTNFKSPYSADVSKILKTDPAARLDAKHPLWNESIHHWGEPEMGYFLSQDEYVIRKDMSMLTDAGVDMLVLDVTNAVRYWDEWEVLFSTMQKMKAEGNKVPKFCFWAFNGPVFTVVQDLYDTIYRKGRYKDLWFHWEGKPLLLYNSTGVNDVGHVVQNSNPHYDAAAATDPHNLHYGDPDYTEKYYKDYTQEVKNFFTKRTMWFGFYEWNGKRFIGTEDNWSYGYQMNDERIKKMSPDDLVSKHGGNKEEAAVTPAQHPITFLSMVGKSWSRENGEPELNEYDLPLPTFVPWLGKTVEHSEGYGIYFQERWDEAIRSDPPFIYVNDWNEWTAYKYLVEDRPIIDKEKTTPFMRRNSNYYFVDQYNAEFNRCIQPMKDGYTDNYYMQMSQNIRRYKGIRPIPVQQGLHSVKIDGQFVDWKKVVNEFRDSRGDTFHRNYQGYGGLNYTNESGRNDIITSKVAVDNQNIGFYVETEEKLTSHSDNNWMLLLIDADNNSETGWYGYDFLINKSVKNEKSTILMRYNVAHPENPWTEVADLKFRCFGNELEIAVPRKLLGLTASQFTFDFKWSDNAADLKDPISLCINGDTAPNRRFNYRCIWEN